MVSLAATDAARNAEGVVAALAALATSGNLAIVYGNHGGPGDTAVAPRALVNGLQTHLPRRPVVTTYVNEQLGSVESRLITDVLDDGGIALVYTPQADLGSLATRLADRVGARQVLRLTNHGIDGFQPLSLPWLIQPAVTDGRPSPRQGND